MTSQSMAQKLADFGTYGLHIIQFPSGRYGFVGTIPVALTEPRSWPTAEAAAEAFNAWARFQSPNDSSSA